MPFRSTAIRSPAASGRATGAIDGRTHFRSGPAARAAAACALRFSTSLHTFALDFLTRKRAPADGSADCRQAFERGRR